MTDANNWIAHNLERQRKILEEKQRQRRLQSGGVQRNTGTLPFGLIGATLSGSTEQPPPIPIRPSSQQQQQRQQFSQTFSIGENRTQQWNFGSGTPINRPSTASQRNPSENSNLFFNSFSNNDLRNISSEQKQQKHDEPTIITVQEFAPFESRGTRFGQNDKATGNNGSIAEPNEGLFSVFSDPGHGPGHRPFNPPPSRSNASPAMVVTNTHERLDEFSTKSTNSAGRPVNVNKPSILSYNGSETEDEAKLAKRALLRHRADSGSTADDYSPIGDIPREQQQKRERALTNPSKGPPLGVTASEQRHSTASKMHSDNRRISLTSAVALGHADDGFEDDEDARSIPTEILEDDTTNALDLADVIKRLDQFVREPLKKNVTLRCKITRDKKGLDKGLFPIYYLHLEKNDGKKLLLLAARRRKKSATANYLISIDPSDLTRSGTSFVAKVRSNAMGTHFTIYDNGENPKKVQIIGNTVRCELVAVIYEPNPFGLKGPRKMTVIIPGIQIDPKTRQLRPVTIRPLVEQDTILERFKNRRSDELVVLNNKKPVWNEDTQSYVLNFHGRVTQASVKNFQLVHSMSGATSDHRRLSENLNFDPDEYIIMQFGRLENDAFTMDVRYPLSPIQAFGIAMTREFRKEKPLTVSANSIPNRRASDHRFSWEIGL